MKRSAILLCCALWAVPLVMVAQTTYSPDQVNPQAAPPPQTRVKAINLYPTRIVSQIPPLSRIAFGVGISPLGGQAQIATNINTHFNLRATGNYFPYSTNFTVNGIDTTANLRMASAGASLDGFPFRNGFRISAGALFYNLNRFSAAAAVPAGNSFTLNGTTFYSASPNSITGATPITGNALLNLHARKPAATATIGWGNMIPRDGGHWSVPFEVGVAYIGAPVLTVNLGGFVCLDQAQTQCYNFATDPNTANARADLSSQVTKWNSDISPFKFYPIVSVGVGYSFKIR